MHNLVRAGELGEVVYMRGGYRHDLRNLLLDDQGNLGNRKKTESIDTHHEGMDYIMLKALEAEMKQERPYPADIHDLALWTSVTPLSIQSVAEQRSVPIE
jgi:hypothetical protein